MIHTSRSLRAKRTQSAEHVSDRLRELAEAGAQGRRLAPHEVKEVCEALRAQPMRTPTHFHSGVG